MKYKWQKKNDPGVFEQPAWWIHRYDDAEILICKVKKTIYEFKYFPTHDFKWISFLRDIDEKKNQNDRNTNFLLLALLRKVLQLILRKFSLAKWKKKNKILIQSHRTI